MRQKLGQHFLASERVLERIARAACPAGTEQVIEIGPGQGALTEHLLAHARVVAIEMDPDLAAQLRERWSEPADREPVPGFRLAEGNALNYDWTQWGAGVMAGNLPYYVATAIIAKFLAKPGALTQGVFLIQKEVAERITALPGTRDFGYLSVECQYLAKAEYLFSVPPGAFRPPPKVDSAVIRLTPRTEPCHDEAARVETKAFLDFASACFRQKRKTLRNNLAGRYPQDILAGMPVLSKRAEQLSVAELLELFRQLAEASRPIAIAD